jgi:hypothetical protein
VSERPARRPLSELQEAMLAHEELAGRPLYNMPFRFALIGQPAMDVLSAAIELVVRRHPVLTAAYHLDSGTALLDAVGLPAPRRLALDNLACLWTEPFDLETEPPIRIGVAQRSADEYVLGLCVHHVAGDTWSAQLLLSELGSAYRALGKGGQPTGPQAVSDFFAHAAAERAHQPDLTPLIRSLAGLGPWRYPRSVPPVAVDTGRAYRVELELAGHTRAVRRLAERAHVSPAAVLLAAVGAAVADGESTVLGLPVVLRDTEATQRMMGPLLNIVPVVAGAGWDGSGAESVRAHADAMTVALRHRDVPYPRLLAALGSQRHAGTAPLFLHVVNVDPDVPRLGLAGLRVVGEPVIPEWAVWPAMWEFSWPMVGSLRGALTVSLDAFDPADAGTLAERLQIRLSALLTAEG